VVLFHGRCPGVNAHSFLLGSGLGRAASLVSWRRGILAVSRFAGDCRRAELDEDQGSSRFKAFDMIGNSRPVAVAIFKAQLRVVGHGNMLGNSIIDCQEFSDFHIVTLWLVAWVPELD
jgi:hypothetical protein